MSVAQSVFETTVKNLPPFERLRLASMILDDLTRSGGKIDYSDEWTEEDMRDFTAASMRRFEEQEQAESDNA
jgi:hypothetical protein